MFEERLLERIGHLEKDEDHRGQSDVNRAIASVVRHLQRMLNSRQGSVPIAMDYGIIDLTNFTGENLGEASRGMADHIRKFIATYEPRLDKVRITFETGDDQVLSLRFKLEGELVRAGKTPVMLETIVNSSGKIVVNE